MRWPLFSQHVALQMNQHHGHTVRKKAWRSGGAPPPSAFQMGRPRRWQQLQARPPFSRPVVRQVVQVHGDGLGDGIPHADDKLQPGEGFLQLLCKPVRLLHPIQGEQGAGTVSAAGAGLRCGKPAARHDGQAIEQQGGWHLEPRLPLHSGCCHQMPPWQSCTAPPRPDSTTAHMRQQQTGRCLVNRWSAAAKPVQLCARHYQECRSSTQLHSNNAAQQQRHSPRRRTAAAPLQSSCPAAAHTCLRASATPAAQPLQPSPLMAESWQSSSAAGWLQCRHRSSSHNPTPRPTFCCGYCTCGCWIRWLQAEGAHMGAQAEGHMACLHQPAPHTVQRRRGSQMSAAGTLAVAHQ